MDLLMLYLFSTSLLICALKRGLGVRREAWCARVDEGACGSVVYQAAVVVCTGMVILRRGEVGKEGEGPLSARFLVRVAGRLARINRGGATGVEGSDVPFVGPLWVNEGQGHKKKLSLAVPRSHPPLVRNQG